MTPRELRKLPYDDLVELARMAKNEIERRDNAEQAEAWNKVGEAITAYIARYGEIRIMLPDGVEETDANSESIDLSTAGFIIVNEVF